MIECKTLYDTDYITSYRYTLPEFKQYITRQGGYLSLDTRGEYIKIPCTFDIETTTYKDEYESIKQDKPIYKRFMYHWQMCVEGVVIFGRNWAEFTEMLNTLQRRYVLDKARKLVIYVHNLSYESVFTFPFVTVTDVFATDVHKVLKATINGVFELRCSYYLSNMSLEKFIENSPDCHYKKQGGDLDYRVMRTPKTDLTPTEYGYCYNDVMGLYERILTRLTDDTVKTIPMTSTGYVRRDCRNAMRKNPNNRKQFIKSQLNANQYNLLKNCFRGGNTASNRYTTNIIIENVGSYDISSSYPYVMLSERYPSGAFMYGTIETLDELNEYNRNYCTIGEYIFKDLKVKDGVPFPYIPISKCINMSGVTNYNGRILQADFIKIGLTNIDYDIIKSQYDYTEMYVDNFYFARADYLPIELREQILHYFTQKSVLKGVRGSEYMYAKNKRYLNSVYGMTVTDILHPVYEWSDGEFIEQTTGDIESYYKSRNNFLSYQWGVFVTRYARKNLQKAIDRICQRGGCYDLIYIDTDSVKYCGDYSYIFNDINNEIIQYCKENNIIHSVDVNGKTYLMGVFDSENQKDKNYRYDKFITMGAKKYAYEIRGKIGVTVSGLNKKDGAKELTKKGGLQFFRLGETFYNSGRTVAYYNNEPIHQITINGETITTRSNIAIVDTTYTLGITDTMLSILNTLQGG